MSAEPAESRPAQRKQARQRSRLTFAITLVFFVCGVVAVVQLLAIHRELNQRAGENIVWALAQAQNHGAQLQRDVERYYQGKLDADALSLQEDVFHSRLALLLDGPQRRSLARYGQELPLVAAIEAFQQAATSTLADTGADQPVFKRLQALLGVLASAGNEVMVRERDERSYTLDRLGGYIQAAFAASLMVVVMGGLLVWQLLQSLERQRTHLRTIAEQRDALQRSVEELHQANNATETYRNFVSLVSHQFRTPLAVIDSTAQRLIRVSQRDGDMPVDQLQQRMGLTRSTIAGLTRLLDSVLTSVKLENGRIQLQAQPMNLAELVYDAIAADVPFLQGRAVHVKVVGERDDYRCAGDKQLLEHVLHNLLANACKYTGASTRIDVVISRTATQLECTVRDWGSGVPAEVLPQLFERFFRAPGTQQLPGSGLGLYLARSIARLHGGDLDASLPHGGGLAVHLRLLAA